MMVTYEPFEELAPEVVELAVTAAAPTRTYRGICGAGVRDFAARPDLFLPACWIARRSAEPVGLTLTVAGDSAATLQLVAVRPDAQRAGIGRSLVDRVVGAAREHGLIEARTLGVDTADAGTCAFFRTLAWQEEEMGSLRMRRDLDDLRDLGPIRIAAGYHIRTYEEQDAEAWVRVRNAAFSTETHSREPWTLETFQKSFLGDPIFAPDRVFLAVRESNGEVAGTTSSWDHQIDGRSVGLIHWVAVAPEHRGKNLGVALMQRALEDMRTRGHREAYLHTNAGLRYAVRLYESLGFVTEQRRLRYRLRWG